MVKAEVSKLIWPLHQQIATKHRTAGTRYLENPRVFQLLAESPTFVLEDRGPWGVRTKDTILASIAMEIFIDR